MYGGRLAAAADACAKEGFGGTFQLLYDAQNEVHDLIGLVLPLV